MNENPSQSPDDEQSHSSGGLYITETPEALRIEWDNRRLKKDYLLIGLVIWWLVWIPPTLLATGMFFVSMDWFLGLWSAVGWLVVICTPIHWLSRRDSEWLELSEASFTVGRIRSGARRQRTYQLGQIAAIYNRGTIDAEHFALGMEKKIGIFSYYETLGYWLPSDLQPKVFYALRSFAEKKGLPLRFLSGDV